MKNNCSYITAFNFSVIVFSFIITSAQPPNFVFLLTDDQDVVLDGMTPLTKTLSIFKENGAEFTNVFVTTPLCCPSRASILTGKYAHNHQVRNNSINGNCNSIHWQKHQETKTFITHFKRSGYETFYAGKYLNEYGKESVGGVEHIPPGWDNWAALVGNSCYYNYSLSLNGERVMHGSNPKTDYLTNVIFDYAMEFVENRTKDSPPFFMLLSVPAPHAPFTPIPPYAERFLNFSAPRTPNFNIFGGKHKHWLLRKPPKPLPLSVIKSIDEVFRNRWRTLLSVDDGVHRIYSHLRKKNLLENTYLIFSSDNGFHLGQFSLPWDKRQMYEFDVRVPLFIRGPGIKQGIQIPYPVLNIDLAPTFLDLANISVPKDLDGKSFAAELKQGPSSTYDRSFIIEHQGEASDGPIPNCPQYSTGEVHTCEIDCICEDSWNNTYVCVRRLSNEVNLISCIFKDNESFGEAYNLTEDPFQLNNLFPSKQFNVIKYLPRKIFDSW